MPSVAGGGARLRATVFSGELISSPYRRRSPLPAIIHQTLRFITDLSLKKRVKNQSLDKIIDRDNNIKAVAVLIDIIDRTPRGVVPALFLERHQKTLGLAVPVLRFLRRYPALFPDTPHFTFPLPSFTLGRPAVLFRCGEIPLYTADAPGAASRLARLLMMCRSRSLPLRVLAPLRYDLGLRHDFAKSLVPNRPDLFRIIKSVTNRRELVLALTNWPEDLAVSTLQLRHANSTTPITFSTRLPNGYGGQKKVKAWMEELDRLPYISPYEDWSEIDPESAIMAKRVVGVLHEILSLTVHKKTKRKYLRSLLEEIGLPESFTSILTKYPGIFYLSRKRKSTTVVLREGYERGKLVDPHPMAVMRDNLYYMMRTGRFYRGHGMKINLDQDELERLEDEKFLKEAKKYMDDKFGCLEEYDSGVEDEDEDEGENEDEDEDEDEDVDEEGECFEVNYDT